MGRSKCCFQVKSHKLWQVFLCWIMFHLGKMAIYIGSAFEQTVTIVYNVILILYMCVCVCTLLQDNLLLDMYIAPHVNALYTQIRNRALIQYFSPYLSADMRKMAAAFNTTVLALEDELMQLILDGQIQARIDSHNKVSLVKTVILSHSLLFY